MKHKKIYYLSAIFYPILFIFFYSHTSSSEEVCYKEDAAINFEGHIHRSTFPGPPNYKSIQKGDKPETYWVLELPKPVCISTEKYIRSLQLIVEPSIYKNKNFLKGKVNVTGLLMAQLTGHHHTPYLVEVKSIISTN